MTLGRVIILQHVIETCVNLLCWLHYTDYERDISFDSRFKVLYFVIYVFNLKFPILVSTRWKILEFSSYNFPFCKYKTFKCVFTGFESRRGFVIIIPKNWHRSDTDSLNVGFSQFIRSKQKRCAGTFEVIQPLPIWLGKRRPVRCGQTAVVVAEPAGVKRRSIWPWKCHPWITSPRTRTITRSQSTDPDTGIPTRVSVCRKHTGSISCH